MVLLLTRPLRPLLSHPPHLYPLSQIAQLLPRHAMSTSSKATPSSTGPTIKASAGEDETALVAAVRALTTKEDGGRWTVVEGGKGLRRGFRFKSFGVCWDFMNTIAAECKVRRHHPEWTNTYNRTTITWTTHKPEGLSIKDVEMAEFCDRVGGEVGEIVE